MKEILDMGGEIFLIQETFLLEKRVDDIVGEMTVPQGLYLNPQHQNIPKAPPPTVMQPEQAPTPTPITAIPVTIGMSTKVQTALILLPSPTPPIYSKDSA